MKGFKLRTYHILKEDEIKNLSVISDEDFEDVINSMLLGDYKNIPEFIRLPDLNEALARELGLEKDSFFVMKKSVCHIRPGRKNSYNQSLLTDEYYRIPEVIRNATFAVVDKRFDNFQIVFDDMNGDLTKINKIVFNKDNFGNYLVTIGKLDRRDAFSEKQNAVVRVGVAPTISALRFPGKPPATRLRPSLTTAEDIVADGSEKSSVSFSVRKASYYSVAAENEPDVLVKARYEEKASYWQKIADGKPVTSEEEARCGPGHKWDAVDHLVYWRHCLAQAASSNDAVDFQRRVGYWRNAALEEQKVNALVRALSERDDKLSVGIKASDEDIGY